MLLVLTQYLSNKYFYNIHLELWVLFFALCSLWFLSDDYLELNLKFVACSVRFFVYSFKYWKNQIMFIELILGNFFIMIIHSFVFMPICAQTALWCILIQICSIVFVFPKTLVFSHSADREGILIPFVIGNYDQEFSFTVPTARTVNFVQLHFGFDCRIINFYAILINPILANLPLSARKFFASKKQ